MSDGGPSLLGYAGVGGVVACCLVLELLGGAAVLGSVAAAVGLSTGLTYVAVIGLVGVLVVLLTLGHQQYKQTNHI
ncbi:hypothetical protein [Halococcus sp. AFM35]|uniref:hypothetical protein n=1 Tax=Halococcus sp. AFM35 TaxID=3421653 RepID=UPI003EBA83A2